SCAWSTTCSSRSPTAARTWPISSRASSWKIPELEDFPLVDGSATQISLGVLVGLVIVALAFDFMNGFHDAANSIATVVSTRVLKPYQAVLLAALFNFVAVFVFHLSVATTVGRGIIDQGIVDHYLVFGALVGAIVWNVITWYYGI